MTKDIFRNETKPITLVKTTILFENNNFIYFNEKSLKNLNKIELYEYLLETQIGDNSEDIFLILNLKENIDYKVNKECGLIRLLNKKYLHKKLNIIYEGE